jgi:hypothetical protein
VDGSFAHQFCGFAMPHRVVAVVPALEKTKLTPADDLPRWG